MPIVSSSKEAFQVKNWPSAIPCTTVDKRACLQGEPK